MHRDPEERQDCSSEIYGVSGLGLEVSLMIVNEMHIAEVRLKSYGICWPPIFCCNTMPFRC